MMFTQIATVVAIAAGAAATPVVRQNSGQATYYQVSEILSFKLHG